ncbi:MAG: histidine kinase dimerization/phospho-acceptor domain-containing protein, partial [Rhodospirillales bacterium]
MKTHRSEIVQLVLVMVAAVLVIGGSALYVLAGQATSQAQAALRGALTTQAGLISAIAKNARDRYQGFPERHIANLTADHVREAFSKSQGFGETGEFVLGRAFGDNIALIARQRDISRIETIRAEDRRAEPMRRALAGQNGVMVGFDYRNIEVIAAFQPVGELGLGLVAKIDKSEVMAPFWGAFWTLGGLCLLVLGAGSVILVRATKPIMDDAEAGARRLMQLADSLPVVIAAVGPDFRYQFVNRLYGEWFDIDRSDIVGKTVAQVVGLDRWKVIGDKMRTAQAGTFVSYEQSGAYFPGVGLRTVRITYIPHMTSDGSRTDSLFVMLQDLTAERQVAEDLIQARRQAEGANRAKSEFLASMSHELRTPLNAIIGFAEMMRAEIFGALGNDRYKDYAGDILTSGEHLLTLINDILDVSAIELGKVELEDEDLDLSGIFDVSARLTRGRAERHQVRLIVNDPGDLPTVRMDRRRSKQMLLNLLSNAVKFTPEGGQVVLDARLNDIGGIDISVTDSGIGMTQPELVRALQPFTQVDNTLTRRFDGTGLGLPLTKSMIEMHGGQ